MCHAGSLFYIPRSAFILTTSGVSSFFFGSFSRHAFSALPFPLALFLSFLVRLWVIVPSPFFYSHPPLFSSLGVPGSIYFFLFLRSPDFVIVVPPAISPDLGVLPFCVSSLFLGSPLRLNPQCDFLPPFRSPVSLPVPTVCQYPFLCTYDQTPNTDPSSVPLIYLGCCSSFFFLLLRCVAEPRPGEESSGIPSQLETQLFLVNRDDRHTASQRGLATPDRLSPSLFPPKSSCRLGFPLFCL